MIDSAHRRAGEGDQSGVRQGVAQEARVAVQVVVVGTMRLVDNDHDVAPLAEQWVIGTRLALFQRPIELLQGGEQDPAGRSLGELSA